MKKIFFVMLAAAGMAVTSCERSFDEIDAVAGGEAKVSVNLEFPTMQTRAYSNGKTATHLQYAVFEKKGDVLTKLDSYTKTDETIDIRKEIEFQLVTGHTYAFVFWAAAPNAPYTVDFATDGATMTVDYTGITANNENLDAFYTYKELEVKGDCQMSAELYRPFAQINVGTNDYAAAKAASYEPTESHMTISKVYSKLDLVSGAVATEAKNVDFAYAAIPSGETFPIVGGNKTEYEYMAMVYALVSAEQAVVEVSFDCKDDVDADDVRAKYTVGSVPVQRNHRTNIYGQLLTSNAKVIVEIVPEYEEPNYEVIAVADGVVYDEKTDTFTVSSPAGLQWVAAQVNSNGGNSYVKTAKSTYCAEYVVFEKQTIELTGDLNMQGVDWTPIGYETKASGGSIYAFAGTFDGKNCTISNLTTTTEENSNAGLFGATNYATIKNLTLEDVSINGHYKTAAFVADAWCTTVDNCHVQGGTITSTPWEIRPNVYDDANNVGGIVGYLCGQPDAAAVTNCTVDGVAITAFRKIGGIVGVASFRKDNYGEPSATITGCTVSNTTITADMTEMRYDGFLGRQAAIGEIVGEAQEGTTMDNNTASDNVTLETKEATKADAAKAKAAINAGGSVYLTEDFHFSTTSYATMTKTLDLNLGGHKLSSAGGGGNKDAVVVGNGAEVSITNGTIDPPTDALDNGFSTTIVVMTAQGGKLTLNDVTVVGNMYPVELRSANANSEIVINSGTYVFTEKWADEQYKDQAVAVYASGDGKITINGGTFGMKGVYSEFLLNVMDSKRKADVRDNIEVRGGKFYNFDPSNNRAEGAGTNFVADGYTVVSYADGEDTIYEVVAK